MRSFSAIASTSLLSCLVLAACGGSPKPAKTPRAEPGAQQSEVSEAADTAAAEPEAETRGLPTECRAGSDPCIPPAKFVERLCADGYPAVALTMLRKGTPWTRAYLNRDTDAANASGGASSDTRFVMGEEVILVAARKPDPNGMQVSGMGGYDVLRWDGTCATLADGELQFSPYGPVKTAPITFRYLEEPFQEALRKDPKVDEAAQMRRKECKGATMGTVSKACEKWDAKLIEAIAAAVRGGIELPAPTKLP
jgi:hypothetical protein